MPAPARDARPSAHGFVRVAAAVPECALAQPRENARRIVALAREASRGGATLVVFPELALTGYTAADLFLQQRLEDAVAQAAADLARGLPRDATAVVGAPWRAGGMLFNAALVFSGGRLRGIVPKTFLPNYKEYYEKRWFVSGAVPAPPAIAFAGNSAPFGTDLLFAAEGSPGFSFGVEICEDLWVPVPPSSFQALAGAQLLVNLSASDETIGKADYRRNDLVAAHSARCIAGLVYVSSGPGESSSDLVFGGHAMIAENGVLLAEARKLQDGATLLLADVDLGRLRADRDRMGSFADAAGLSGRRFRTIPCGRVNSRGRGLRRAVDPQPFVPNDPGTREARCQEVADIASAGLARRLLHLPDRRPVLGLSGGLDSALAALLSVRALAALRQRPRRLLAVSMPGAGTSPRTRGNARALARALGAEFREIDIRAAVAAHLRDIGHRGRYDITFENAQARERTQVLMDLANQERGFVVGTGDLSEIALGFSTFAGDQTSMYDVNASIPKTLVRHVVVWFASHAPAPLRRVLSDVLATPASPELLPPGARGAIAQRTERIVGPYELHDFFLYHFVREGCPPEKMLFLARHAFGGRYREAVLARTLSGFLERFFSAQFKRNAMPDGPKVGSVALSPRGDWRMSADVRPATWLEGLPRRRPR